MNAQAWAAFGAVAAVLVSALALYYTRQSADAAKRAAKAAEDQTKIQRQLRIDSVQPYVWADVLPDDRDGIILCLIVGNSGPTVATNVRVTFDPPLNSIAQLKDRADAAQAALASGLASLPPGRTLTWLLGPGFSLLNDDRPKAHTCTVTADGPFGPVPPLTYILDNAALRGQPARRTGNLDQVAQAISAVAEAVGGQSRRNPAPMPGTPRQPADPLRPEADTAPHRPD